MYTLFSNNNDYPNRNIKMKLTTSFKECISIIRLFYQENLILFTIDTSGYTYRLFYVNHILHFFNLSFTSTKEFWEEHLVVMNKPIGLARPFKILHV